MSIFGTILSKIFPSNHPAVANAEVSSTTAGAAPAATAPAAAAPAQASPMPEVDVENVLTGLASKSGEKLNWQSSIVDLMKLLGLDSSLAARKQLAGELHYSGNTEDSASMNIWLHKQVMTKLAENGGKVPDSLKN